MAISEKSMATLMKAIAPVIAEHVQKVTAPLRQRIKELEAKPSLRYCGSGKPMCVMARGRSSRSTAQPG